MDIMRNDKRIEPLESMFCSGVTKKGLSNLEAGFVFKGWPVDIPYVDSQKGMPDLSSIGDGKASIALGMHDFDIDVCAKRLVDYYESRLKGAA